MIKSNIIIDLVLYIIIFSLLAIQNIELAILGLLLLHGNHVREKLMNRDKEKEK